MMQTQSTPQSRVRRTVNELIMAEMFLLQATIESATVIGSGLNALGKQISLRDDAGEDNRQSFPVMLQRIAEDAMEPYSSRYRYFQELLKIDA